MTKSDLYIKWGIFLLNLSAFILNLTAGNIFFIILNGGCALWYGILLWKHYSPEIDLSWVRKLDFKSKR